MFLKNEPFTFNGETITLFELSGLQRINHLAHLTEQANNAPSAEESEEIMTSELVAINIRNSALLVAMSLWHNDRTGKQEKELYEEVLSEWPVTAIGEAEKMVKTLSCMIIPEPEEAMPVVEIVEKEKNSPEKSLPVS